MNQLEQIEQRFAIKEDQTYSDASPEVAIAYLVKRLEAAEAALDEQEAFNGHKLCKLGTCYYCDSYPKYLAWHEVAE